MDEELSTGVACRWCRWLGAQGATVIDDPAFVVVETPTRRRGRCLTLVPRAHVNVVTELPLPQMAAVLAGLSRASDVLRYSSGEAGVQVNALPHSGSPDGEHLHFQVAAVQLGKAFSGYERAEPRNEYSAASVISR